MMRKAPDQWAKVNLDEIDVVLPSLNRRWSGVTSTVAALLPLHQRTQRIAVLGHQIPAHFPHVGWLDILLRGWTPPKGRSHRIWHARRNAEMLPGVLLARVLRQPWKLVFTSAAQRQHSAWTKFLIRRMDAVIAVSDAAASFLDVPCEVSFHGVDTGRFRPAADRAAAWEAAGPGGTRGVGIFGRIRAQKGTDLFAGSLIALLPRYPGWTAVITGEATPQEAGFAASLKAKIAAAGLEDRVFWLGLRPAAEIPLLMQALSLVVAPPRKEGFGLLPLEAMASGTPVVASRAGTHAEQVPDGDAAALFDAGDAAALTAAMERYFAMDSEAIDAAGAEGRAHVLAHHRLQGEAARIEAVYARLAPAV